MPDEEQYDVQAQVMRALMDKVADDPYPSATMLDMIEALLKPEDVPEYAEALLDRIREDRFPSISLINRVENLAS